MDRLSLGELIQSWSSKHHPYIDDTLFLSPALTSVCLLTTKLRHPAACCFLHVSSVSWLKQLIFSCKPASPNFHKLF